MKELGEMVETIMVWDHRVKKLESEYRGCTSRGTTSST